MMNEWRRRKRASAVENGDFVCVETESGHGSTAWDPEAKQHLLPPDVSDDELGQAVLDALAHSRHMSVEEACVFLEYRAVKVRYDTWVAALMERYGYKTRRALFKSMKNCSAECVEGRITIAPTRHEKLEGWGREKDDGIEDVVIPADSPPAAVGAALRLAFSRCR